MEHISTTTLIITLIVMVIISAYFSGSETGMMTLNRYRLRHMAKQGNRPAKRVEKLLRKPDRLISLVLIGNNLVNILASALGTIVGMRLYGDAGVAIATVYLPLWCWYLPKCCRRPSPPSIRKRSPTPAASCWRPAGADDAAGVAAEYHHPHTDAHDGHPHRYRHQQRPEQR